MSFRLGLVTSEPDSQEIRDLIDSLESDGEEALSNYSPVGSDQEDDFSTDEDETKQGSSNVLSSVTSENEAEEPEQNQNTTEELCKVIDLVDSDNDEPPKKIFRKSNKGRLLDPIWEKYLVEHGKKGVRISATCPHCGKFYKAPKSNRLTAHYNKCQKPASCTSPNVQSLSEVKSESSVIQLPSKQGISNWLKESSKSIGTVDSTTCRSSSQDQPTISKMLERKAVNNELIDTQIGRFVFSSLVSFKSVEDAEFIKLMKIGRPSYVPPSAKRISTSILDKVYDEVTSQVSSTSEGQFATIMQDGWSGQQSSPIISHSLNLEGKTTQFLNATNAKNETKTSDFCLRLLTKSIDEAEGKYKCKIGAVVTDNTNSMVCMRNLLQLKNPDIMTYGCNVHLFNLVGKDFISKDFSNEVKKIQHYFRDHTKPRETLKQMKAKQPVIPCDVRWNSNYSCMTNFLENHAAYVEIAKSDGSMNAEIKEKLMDLEFFAQVKAQRELASPIVDAISKLQADYSNVADAVRHWIEIKETCFALMDIATQKKFTNRMDYALEPFVCAAYLLQPKYKGKNLGSKYTSRGQEWLTEKSALFVVAQVKLSLNDQETYSGPMLNEEILGSNGLSPAQWWMQVGTLMCDKLPAGLADLAVKLMMLPASTSGIERCFSTMGNIMTDSRNRIGLEKTAKLCMISRFLKAKNAK